MKVKVVPTVIGALGTVPNGLETGRIGNLKKNQDQTNNSTVMNTQKSPGDLGRLVVTQTTVKYHQLTLVGKTL